LVTAKEVPPGGAGEIKATFKTKGFQGPAKKSFTVQTNDPDNKRIKLTLKGKVISEVTVEPRYLNMGTVNKDERPEPVSMTVKLRQGKGLKIKDVKVDSEAVVLTKEKETPEESIYLVSLADKVPLGRLTGRITVKTNSSKAPEVKVPFYAIIQGNIKVNPQLLHLGIVRPGTPLTRHITLSKTGEQGFQVEGVKATSEQITTEIRPEIEGEKYRINVSYDPGSKTKGRISERLTITVKSEEEEEILEIPVYGTIHEKKAKKPASPKVPAGSKG